MGEQTQLPASGQPPPWPSPGRAWYMVAILAIAYALSFLDRQILNLLVGPIRRDMQISDFQMSLLMGIAFAAFYSIAGLPISRLIDRGSRRLIIFWGITFWSLMTAACGVARTYPQLFLARVGIGVGEATLNPSAFSMISDSFEEKRRALAIAVFHMGNPVGRGLALIIGGTVVGIVASWNVQDIPFVPLTYSWQLVFLLVGMPGVAVALLMLTVREPVRRGLLAVGGGGNAPARQVVSIGEVAAFINARRAAYFAVFFGVGLKVMLSYGQSSWVPTFFIRVHGWSAAEFGLLYGSILVFTGILATLLAGWLADRMAARGHRDASMLVILWGYFIAIPFAVAAPLMANSMAGFALYVFTDFITSAHVLAPAALVAITPNQMRGQVSAIYVFSLNMLGLGIGPSVIAGFTDFVFQSDQALGYSLALAAATLGPLGWLVLWGGLKPYRRCLQDALAWEQAPASRH